MIMFDGGCTWNVGIVSDLCFLVGGVSWYTVIGGMPWVVWLESTDITYIYIIIWLFKPSS